MSHKKAIAITCFVALMWSLAGFNIKMIEWSPYAIAAGRSLVAVILLAPMVLRKGFQKIDRYVIGGAICYAAFNYCFITSTTLTSSAIAIMMQYTALCGPAVLALSAGTGRMGGYYQCRVCLFRDDLFLLGQQQRWEFKGKYRLHL